MGAEPFRSAVNVAVERQLVKRQNAHQKRGKIIDGGTEVPRERLRILNEGRRVPLAGDTTRPRCPCNITLAASQTEVKCTRTLL